MSNWIDIAALNDIPKRGARVVKTSMGCVAIFRTIEDRVFAISDTCPHKQGPLHDGMVHGNAVTCPLHNLVIDLETGLSADGASRVDTYEIKVNAGRILLDATHLTA